MGQWNAFQVCFLQHPQALPGNAVDLEGCEGESARAGLAPTLQLLRQLCPEGPQVQSHLGQQRMEVAVAPARLGTPADLGVLHSGEPRPQHHHASLIFPCGFSHVSPVAHSVGLSLHALGTLSPSTFPPLPLGGARLVCRAMHGCLQHTPGPYCHKALENFGDASSTQYLCCVPPRISALDLYKAFVQDPGHNEMCPGRERILVASSRRLVFTHRG